MEQKWKIFALTFLSYALIHSIRTAWSSLKYSLNSAPYSFSPIFLGTLDMIVLLTLAISLNLLGPTIEKLGPKSFLLRGTAALGTVAFLIGSLLVLKVTVRWPYAILYPLVGICSCVGWPACIFILSQYFKKGLAFSLWHGSSQFGDFVALVTSFLFIEKGNFNPGFFLYFMTLLLAGTYFLNRHKLPDLTQSHIADALPQMSPAEKQIQALVQEGDDIAPPLSQTHMTSDRRRNTEQTKKPVNFLTVWKLPGVPGYILSFLFVKSVNAVVVTWLVFYLSMIDMVKESRMIALLWAVSTFIGGLLGSYFNPKFNKKIFVAALFASSIFFVFLEEVHLYPNQIEVIVLVVACGLTFGGPFTLMSTSIPLLLSEKPGVRDEPGAKAAIISAMEGYGLLFCGVSLLIIPAVGVIDLHWIACLYCFLAGSILLYEQLKEDKQKKARESIRRARSEPIVGEAKQRDLDWSVQLGGVSDIKRKRVKRTRSRISSQAGKQNKEEHLKKNLQDDRIQKESSQSEQSQKDKSPVKPNNPLNSAAQSIQKVEQPPKQCGELPMESNLISQISI